MVPSDSTARRDLSPLVFLLLLALINLSVPFLPLHSRAAAMIGGFTLTLAYVGAVVAFGLGVAKKRLAIPVALGCVGVCVLVWLAVQFGFEPIIRRTARELFQTKTRPSLGQQLLFSSATTLQDSAMIGGACVCGTLLSRLIRHANMLGPIVASIALIDIWGVLFGGIVSQLLSNKATQPLAEKAMAAGPKLGAASAHRTGFSLSIPSIGIGDFLFLALLLSVLVNLGMNWRTSARLMWVFISFALLSILFLPWFPALPGLVFIGLGALLPNWKSAKFTREEQFALLYAGIFVLILTVALYFGFKSALPSK
jgi:hypothetical protein